MKVLNKITPYSIKRAVPVLGMAFATMLGGCKKHETPEPKPTKDIEIVFGPYTTHKILPENMQATLDSLDLKSIRNIYLVPEEGRWGSLYDNAIPLMRKNGLEPCMRLSPKIRGRGDFNFCPGNASMHPEDSLWYVQHGWTINKRFIENNQAQK